MRRLSASLLLWVSCVVAYGGRRVGVPHQALVRSQNDHTTTAITRHLLRRPRHVSSHVSPRQPRRMVGLRAVQFNSHVIHVVVDEEEEASCGHSLGPGCTFGGNASVECGLSAILAARRIDVGLPVRELMTLGAVWTRPSAVQSQKPTRVHTSKQKGSKKERSLRIGACPSPQMMCMCVCP